MKQELLRLAADQFAALILDNEVTVGEFATVPPLPWTRLVQRSGIFHVAQGYPTVLTAAQAKFEMRNWDEVSLPAVMRALAELTNSQPSTFISQPSTLPVDYVLFGNNAGQGFPLAQSLPPHLIASRAAIIYANSLPEKSAYERLGYRNFFPRGEAVARLLELARNAGRPLALYFINTIQHNEFNYHDP